MKLEEGKWYRWFHTSHATYHIGKHFNSPDENIVRMSPWLIGGDEYKIIGSFESKFMQDIVEITDLTEISKILPDGHENKVVTPKSERYITTMKFFEQLKEPERSEAIENYNETYSSVPDTITEAISHGFDWTKSKQGYKYWYDIHTSIEGNTYFKEPEPEVLVFGKYKIGDIVVSLTDFKPRYKGDIYEVLKRSNDSVLFYLSTTNSSDADNWRLATPEEVEAYNSGIRNINDIKPKSLEGRYIKCLKENDWNDGKTKVGDILKIRKSDSVGDLFIGPYCLDSSRLRDGEFELLPIDYTPDLIKEEAIPDKPTEYIAKVGDYVEVIDAFNNCFKLGDIVECIAEERFRDRFGFVQVLSPKRYKAVSVGTKLVSNTPPDLITRDVSILNTFISMYDTFDMYGNKIHPLTPKEAYPNYSLPVPTNIILKTKSKSIKL